MGQLSHLDEDGQARMVDVAAKDLTEREATAECVVWMSSETAAKVVDGTLPKGEVAPLVRLAGIQAAKRTSELIPLCHQIALTSVDVDLSVDVDTGRATITATARAVDRTGVEMEALTAVSVAGLALYDMVKGVQRDVLVTDVRLVAKSGGGSGDWTAD
jgi:cyclic pyranopterin phosphate synthase